MSRVLPALSAQVPRLAFIPPLSPTLTDAPPVGDNWLHEIKHDGFRTLVLVERGRARAFQPSRPRLDRALPTHRGRRRNPSLRERHHRWRGGGSGFRRPLRPFGVSCVDRCRAAGVFAFDLLRAGSMAPVGPGDFPAWRRGPTVRDLLYGERLTSRRASSRKSVRAGCPICRA